jgi:hypothetical protein
VVRSSSRRLLRAGLAVLALGLLAPAVAAPAAPADGTVQEWRFRVFLDDREIGTHEFRVRADGGIERVEIDARFDVRFLFINAYRYRHQNVEVWQDGCLQRIEAQTDDNGDLLQVSGRTDSAGFVVDGARGDTVLDNDCVASFAYWNPEILDAGRLLNAQTGEYVNVDIEIAAEERLVVDGRELPARRYTVAMEDGYISLWYHRDNGQWLALESPTPGGRLLRYEPIQLPFGPQPDERLAAN